MGSEIKNISDHTPPLTLRKAAFPFFCMTAGLAVRVLWLADWSKSPLFWSPVIPDAVEYYNRASEIISGKLLWGPADIHSPLYPYSLAFLRLIFREDLFWVRLAQLVICLFSALPFWAALRSALNGREGTERLPWLRYAPNVFLLIWAFYIPVFNYQAELFCESLLFPLFAGAVWFLMSADISEGAGAKRKTWLKNAAAGFLSGLAVVTHPLALFFAAGAASLKLRGALKAKGSFPAAALIFTAAAILPPALVTAYSAIMADRAVFIQGNSGFNFWLGNSESATGGCFIRPGPEWDAVHARAKEEEAAAHISADRWFIREAFKYIISHPFSWAALTLKKAALVFNFRDLAASTNTALLKLNFTDKHIPWGFALIGIPALAGLFLGAADREFRRAMRWLIVLFLALWIGQVIFVTSGRYRAAMFPALCAFAAWFLCVAPSLVHARRGAVRVSLSLAAAAAIVLLPVPRVDIERESHEAELSRCDALIKSDRAAEAAVTLARLREFELSRPELSKNDAVLNMLGDAAMRAGDFPAAEKYYSEAVKNAPSSYYGYMNLGTVYSRTGRQAAAAERFKKAAELNPGAPDALYNLALSAQALGDIKTAKEKYKECLARSPAHKKSLNNLGIIFLTEGNGSGAESLFERAVRLDPSAPGPLVNLAAARASAGKISAARALLEKVLKEHPDEPRAKELMRQLRPAPR
jgi:Tfp pilus assembly protein PilF